MMKIGVGRLPVLCGAIPLFVFLASMRLPSDDLLLYRGDDGKPEVVETRAEWERRRAEILQGMQRVMGTLPGPRSAANWT